MDFLNRAFAQVSDLFNSMTAGARITSGLLLVVVVVILAYLFHQKTSGPGTFLMNGEPVAASQIPAMEAAFAQAGLSDYVVEGNRIRVPQGRHSAYMGALADADALPPNFGNYIGKALEKSSMWISSSRQKELLKNAKQNELALIIRSMKGIEKAAVLYDEQPQRGLKRGKIVTASISVKSLGNKPLDAEKVPTLRNLVASAIAGLSPTDVTVTDLNSGRVFVATGKGIGGAMNDLYLARKKMYERDWTKKILNNLSYISGVLVDIEVGLNPETLNRETSTTHDPQKIGITARSERSTIKSKEPVESGRGGLPGPAANQAGGPRTGPATLTSARRSMKESEELIESDKFGRPSTTSVIKEKHGLTPERVKVALGIPFSYLEKVYKKENPEQTDTPTRQQLCDNVGDKLEKQLKTHIANLIPQWKEGTDPRNDVEIMFFDDFADEIMIEDPTFATQAIGWFGQNGGSLGMGLLAVFSLFMLRSMVRHAPPPAPAGRTSTDGDERPDILPMTGIVGIGDEEATPPEKRLQRRLSSGPSLKEELVDIVREDPDTAANILRTWIGNAG